MKIEWTILLIKFEYNTLTIIYNQISLSCIIWSNWSIQLLMVPAPHKWDILYINRVISSIGLGTINIKNKPDI